MSQQMYGPPPRTGAPVPPHALPPRNGLGTAALILGIIGVVMGVIPFMFWLGGILGIIALILGLSGRGKAKRGEATNKGTATAGAVLGPVAVVLSVVMGVVTFMAVDDAVNEINKSVSETGEKGATGKNGGGGGGKEKAGDDGAADSGAAGGETYAAGDTVVYDDGVQVTVSRHTAYAPGEFAIGHKKGNKAYKVTVTVVNKGKEKFDTALLTVDARAGKDGKTAESIFDDKIGQGFNGTVVPGRTATAEFAFDTPAGAKTLEIEVSPGWSYHSSHWNLEI
ncbi:DUF4352 domain-containing protein [Streptomyces sp. WAC 00631]|uniref:DUF4190 domain-containing protein n=1 Tax=Streptomyces sp. WAC 00631 TaxID=2203201 RepID=UPI000F77F921|nr:DUF4190 domain-containing protein [Streptomyces sp. WAC 00631]MCC5033017.1 DUF4352 domain-containing protein [Streptomyces sp. WAC 00631]